MDTAQSATLTPELLEQNPLLAAALTLFALFFLTLLAGSLGSWVVIGVRLKRGLPLLPSEAWQPRVWGLSDVVLIAIAAVSCQLLFAQLGLAVLGVERGSLDRNAIPLELTAIINFGNVAAVAIAVLWLTLRYRVSLAHVGFRLSRLPRQVAIALVSGLACLPVVYLLMALVSIGFSTQYKHPLLDELRASATLGTYLMGAATAVLVAPLAEEFLFRVIIQGWLQSLSRSSILAAVLGASHASRRDPQSPFSVWYQGNHARGEIDISDGTQERSALDGNGSSSTPAESTATELTATDSTATDSTATGLEALEGNRPFAPSSPLTAEVLDDWQPAPPLWPAIVTGILFGFAHWGYGLSFIPLIAMGILLGLLYRSTQSIWPCFIVHFMLNASSMLALGVSILVERAA